MNVKPANLYIVSTPIGNLADITHRALEVLKGVDLIAAEDTRHSKKLLTHYHIDTPLVAYHSHNETSKSQQLLKKLQAGQSLALISDAGTPLISDPGHSLVELAIEHHIDVTPVPGPSAVITALSASGLACDKFYFGGFLPIKAGQREERLKTYLNIPMTGIFYEAPHRIVSFIKSLQQLEPERTICLAKELTKHFENFIRGTPEHVLNALNANPDLAKGEFVVLVQAPLETSQVEFEQTLKCLLNELPLKQAVKLTAEITGANKNTIYQQALALKNKS